MSDNTKENSMQMDMMNYIQELNQESTISYSHHTLRKLFNKYGEDTTKEWMDAYFGRNRNEGSA